MSNKKVTTDSKDTPQNDDPTTTEAHKRFHADFLEFVKEFKGESDRAAVVLGASKLDQLLGMVLEKYLLPCPNSTDDLFSHNGPLGTFSSKIDLAYRLGLIDSTFCRSIHMMRKIRNSFAHEVYGASLNGGSHKDRIKSLVSLIKDHYWFRHLKEAYFDDRDDSRTDFSAALGLMIVRLEGLLHGLKPLSKDGARTLAPEKYKNQSESEKQSEK